MKTCRTAWLGTICLAAVLQSSWGAEAESAAVKSADDANQITLDAPPLPEHKDRKPADPAATRPKAAKDSRGEAKESAAGRRMPIPTQPARDLPEVGEPTTEENAPPALFDWFPHYGPKGALNGEFIYTGETFALAHGGLSNRRTASYRGNLDMVLNLDLDVAAGIKGGRIFVYGQNVHGRPLSINDVGDFQLFSNIDSTISPTARPQYTAVAEYWYEQYLADNRLRMKFGKQDSNADFAYSDVGGDFINSSFGLPPTIPLPTFPSQALGASFFWSATDKLVLAFGIYDGTLPPGPQGVRWGFDTLGHNGAIMLTQAEWKGQGGRFDQLPSTVRIGGWLHTDDDVWADVTDGRIHNNNAGGWLIGDQMLWKEEYGTDDTQGLAGFVMYSWTYADRNPFSSSLAGGLVYKGLLSGREDDLLGIGVTAINVSGDYRNAQRLQGTILGPNEIATELFYKIQLSPTVVLQPEVQFISSPGAQYNDALLYGIRFEAVL